MCLSDPDTAILIGGETADQNYCEDSLWKLELGQWSLLLTRVVVRYYKQLRPNWKPSNVCTWVVALTAKNTKNE